MGRIELEWDVTEGPGLPDWVARALEGSSSLEELRDHIDQRLNALIALEAITMGQFEDLKAGVADVSAATSRHAAALQDAVGRVEAKISSLGEPDPDLTAELASLRDAAASLDSQTTALEQLAAATPSPAPGDGAPDSGVPAGAPASGTPGGDTPAEPAPPVDVPPADNSGATDPSAPDTGAPGGVPGDETPTP